MTTNNQRKPKRWELYKKEFQIPELRTDEPVGLYPRQSTERQKKKNRQSFEKQTIDAIEDLMKRGWIRELIRLYDQDNGHSAACNLEDREAMDQMLADIREKRIRTVRAAEVDRLFRDEDRIDSNVFIKVCREADCLVITDRMTYNFSIPRHVDYFRDEVDRAWKFYESQILIRAAEHQDRARRQGLYSGGPLPIGYIVDKNPKSPTYLKYIPYSRHAERSLELFQWLYDCGGIIGVVVEKLDKLPYVWELEEHWIREQKAFWTNLEVVYGVELDEEGKPKPIGYRISADGLRRFYKNRVFRGDWPYDGEWIESNHQAIVPADLWDFAQACLVSDVSTEAAEPRNYHTPTVSTIHDILYPGPEGTKKRYITLRNVRGQYNIVELRRTKRVVLALIDMDDIEQQFLQKFTERLKETQRFDDYEQRLAKAEDEQKIKERKKNLRDTIHELNERIDGLFLTLQSTRLKPQERDEYIVERQRLIRRREAVQNEMNIQSPVQVYLKYKDLFQQMGKYWHRYSFEDRQALVALLVRRVYIEPLSHHFMKITIEWKAFPKDEGILYRRNASTLYWEPEEDQILRELYPTAQVETVQKALPRRSWNGIRTRGSDLHIRRLIKTKLTFPTDMSLQDLQIVETYGIPGDKVGETLFTTWG